MLIRKKKPEISLERSDDAGEVESIEDVKPPTNSQTGVGFPKMNCFPAKAKTFLMQVFRCCPNPCALFFYYAMSKVYPSRKLPKH